MCLEESTDKSFLLNLDLKAFRSLESLILVDNPRA